MKITLISPNLAEQSSSLYPSLGLSYIASVLEKNGYQPIMVDLTFEGEAEKLAYDSDVYGITCTTALLRRSLEIAKEIKQKNPKCTIVLGGPHPTILPDEVIANESVDAVCIGEGEYTFLEIVQHVEKKEPISDVKGVAYKNDGKIMFTEPRQPIENLDELPFPSQHLFPLEKYFEKTGIRQMSIITTRGCPGNCTFCQPTVRKLFGKRIRWRDPVKVVDEIELISKKHRLDIFVISDDTFAWNPANVETMCKEMIGRKINVLWRCQTRVNTPKETLKWMKKAGCIGVAFGVESGSQKILDNIQKNIKVEDIKKAFKDCEDIGMLAHAYVMVGNIGEDKNTIQETKDLLREIKPFNMNVSITTPYPGTQLYDYAKANGLLLSNDWDDCNHIRADTKGIRLENMTPEDVSNAKKDIESYFEAISKKYKKWQLLKSIDSDMFVRLAKMGIKSPKGVLRLFTFQKRAVKKSGFTLFK